MLISAIHKLKKNGMLFGVGRDQEGRVVRCLSNSVCSSNWVDLLFKQRVGDCICLSLSRSLLFPNLMADGMICRKSHDTVVLCHTPSMCNKPRVSHKPEGDTLLSYVLFLLNNDTNRMTRIRYLTVNNYASQCLESFDVFSSF